MRPKRRTQTAPTTRYRHGSSATSTSEVSETEGKRRPSRARRTKSAGNQLNLSAKQATENVSTFSKTSEALNKLSQQYLARESSGCEADSECSTTSPGSGSSPFDFVEADDSLKLFLSPKKKGKEKKNMQGKKAKTSASSGQKENKIDSENEQKLKRKFSSLGLSDLEKSTSIVGENSATNKNKKSRHSDLEKSSSIVGENFVTNKNKKPRHSVAFSFEENDVTMDSDSVSHSRELLISPIMGQVVKLKRFTAIKDTSTPTDFKPINPAVADDGCFGFDSIMSPEPEVSPVRKISSMEYISSRPSVSPTDFGSPELKPMKKALIKSSRTEKPGLRKSKRLSALVLSPEKQSFDSSTESALTLKENSPEIPKSGRSGRRLMRPVHFPEKASMRLSTTRSAEKKPVKRELTKSVETSLRKSVESMQVDSGIHMTFDDSKSELQTSGQIQESEQTEDLLQGLFLLEPKRKSKRPSIDSPSYADKPRKSSVKALKAAKSGTRNTKEEKQFNQWALKVNDELSEIEMFDLVVSS